MGMDVHDETKPYPDHIGAHAVEVQGDVIRMQFHGMLLPADAQGLTALADRVGARPGGRVFFIANLRDAGPPGPEARRVFASWRPRYMFITVYFGAVLQQQAFAALIEGAMHAASGKPTRGRFVETEAEALAFVADEQRRLGA